MNILLITSDQQRADTLFAYGSQVNATPHLDRLARDGMVAQAATRQHLSRLSRRLRLTSFAAA